MSKRLYGLFAILFLLCGLSACSKPETALPAQTTVLSLGASLTPGVGASSAQTSYPSFFIPHTHLHIITGCVS